jgi:Ca-activated chloride channel homolog
MSLAACAVALVLLMDASGSISDGQMRMQRNATADALVTEDTVRIVENTPDGVALYAAAFGAWPEEVVSWVHARNRQDLYFFANQLRRYERPDDGIQNGTYTGRAIRFAANQFQNTPCIADEHIIDVTTDGETEGESLRAARNEAGTAGISINAIAMRGGTDLADWLRENLITSNGFVMTARDEDSFHRAIRRKIIMELAGLP